MLQVYRIPPEPLEVDESLDEPPIEPLLPLRLLVEPLPVPLVVADEPGEEPLLSRLVVVSRLVVEPLGFRVVLVELPAVLPVVFGESLDTLGIDPVPFEPRLIVLDPVDESLPAPPRFMPDPVVPPLVPPLMPDVPLPLVPVPLEPPDDCACAIPMVAAKTAAAKPAPILVVAFMLFS